MWFEILLGILFLIFVLLFGFIFFLFWLLKSIFLSVQPAIPQTHKERDEDNVEHNPLFRHIPELKNKLLWSELGVYPTPVHKVNLKMQDRVVSFWLKREDLCSNIYGGNKVRTLQYQIPAYQAHAQAHPSAKFYVVGSGGSNQVVATMAHGARFGLKFGVLYPKDDAPDLDNTLNLLSTLSFRPSCMYLWDTGLLQLKMILGILSSKEDKIIGPGGNSIVGILGQIGGALELAEQIASGEIPDIDEIYLPMGSSCTTTGLILGVCLARHLKLKAFRSQRFKIVSVAIHGDFVKLHNKTNLMRNWIGNYFALSPGFGIRCVSAYLKKLCGIDLEPAGLEFIQREWDLVSDAEIAGKYGAHSEKSAKACEYDVELEISGNCPDWLEHYSSPPKPWLCGHFAGKSFTVLLDRLLQNRDDKANMLLWQTKSYTQPLGDKDDEWIAIKQKAANSKILKDWSDSGKATSALRPGEVNLDGGKPEDYRKLMTPVFV